MIIGWVQRERDENHTGGKSGWEPRVAWGWVSGEKGLEEAGLSDYLHLHFSPYFSAIASYHGFNLDVENPIIFQENAAGFGRTVVQFGGSR